MTIALILVIYFAVSCFTTYAMGKWGSARVETAVIAGLAWPIASVFIILDLMYHLGERRAPSPEEPPK